MRPSGPQALYGGCVPRRSRKGINDEIPKIVRSRSQACALTIQPRRSANGVLGRSKRCAFTQSMRRKVHHPSTIRAVYAARRGTTLAVLVCTAAISAVMEASVKEMTASR
jgi:hypothetical protein